MSIKIINLTIPSNENIPNEISSFSPEENLKMIKIGCECLLEGRKAIAGLTQQEIYNKIKDESKEAVEKMELDILVERELSKKMEENISKMHEGQISKLEKQMALLLKQLDISNQQIKNYESENTIIIQKEVDKLKYNYDLLLQEKDKQNQLNREVFDKAEKIINKNLNKSSISIGDDGEQIFENLSDTFKDFAEYKIENKTKQGHKGDFHLFFKDFNILVDSKNYSGSVQKKEIIKIETDLLTNDNMKFAWMVSLNTNINDYNRFPIMTKWITTDVGAKCILFINNLLEYKDPRSILRQAWTICNDFYRLTKSIDKEDGELEKYREKSLKQKKQINNLQDRATELRRGMNVLNNSLKNLDNDLLEILELISDDIINEKIQFDNIIIKWWNNNIEYVNDENKITSTELWNKFKKENKEYILDNKITIETFKNIITSNIVNNSNYVEKTKKGVIEFIGFKWREIEIKELKNLIIENAVMGNIVIEQKPKKKTKIKTKFYFSEEKDSKILKDYQDDNNDIMIISTMNNILPWQVVSLLVQYKVISKRGEAHGYDKYKETDEYKEKIIIK
jgi:hypothetical protein